MIKAREIPINVSFGALNTAIWRFHKTHLEFGPVVLNKVSDQSDDLHITYEIIHSSLGCVGRINAWVTKQGAITLLTAPQQTLKTEEIDRFLDLNTLDVLTQLGRNAQAGFLKYFPQSVSDQVPENLSTERFQSIENPLSDDWIYKALDIFTDVGFVFNLEQYDREQQASLREVSKELLHQRKDNAYEMIVNELLVYLGMRIK